MKRVHLDNLFECSDQEVFDFVAHHLLKQNQKCVFKSIGGQGSDTCLYRHGGLACAAGCLFTDDQYSEDYDDGYSWTDLVDKYKLPDDHCELIMQLQGIHDDHVPPEWPDQLSFMARAFGLRDSIPHIQITLGR
jgi:hypothetical protein